MTSYSQNLFLPYNMAVLIAIALFSTWAMAGQSDAKLACPQLPENSQIKWSKQAGDGFVQCNGTALSTTSQLGVYLSDNTKFHLGSRKPAARANIGGNRTSWYNRVPPPPYRIFWETQFLPYQGAGPECNIKAHVWVLGKDEIDLMALRTELTHIKFPKRPGCTTS